MKIIYVDGTVNVNPSDLIVWSTGHPLSEDYKKKISERNVKRGRNTINGLHRTMEVLVPKPDLCSYCHIRPPYDLANVSDTYNPLTYNMEVENWQWLCRSCHMDKDGRLIGLHTSKKK